MSAEGSHVKGFRLQDFDTKCQRTGQHCPEREKRVLEFVGWVTKHSDPGDAEAGRVLLTESLTELSRDSQSADYAASEPDVCAALNVQPPEFNILHIIKQRLVKG